MQVWHTPNRFLEETIDSIVFMTGMQISQMRQLGINICGGGGLSTMEDLRWKFSVGEVQELLLPKTRRSCMYTCIMLC
jgi:hypothetical protein